MSDTELRAEVERLTTLNDRLSKQVIGMSDRLDASRRELLATGWDEAVNEADRRWQIGAASTSILKADNPYRQPIDTLGGGQ
jgi:hypothetical protein